MRAKYCKCNNTYTIDNCDIEKCKQPEYWVHDIGSVYKEEE